MNSCFHCGQPVPDQFSEEVEVLGHSRPMCCHGCAEVTKLIVRSGMSSFYQHRSQLSATPEEIDTDALTFWDQLSIPVNPDSESCTTSLYLEGIECAACVWLIEQGLEKLPGVLSAQVNMGLHTLRVTYQSELALSQIVKAVEKLGFKASVDHPDQRQKQARKRLNMLLLRIGIAGVACMQVMMYAGVQYHDIEDSFRQSMRWLSLIVCLPVVLFSAWPFFTGAYRAIRNRHLTMDVPVSLAVGLSYLASAKATYLQQGEVYFESVAMFTFFLLCGRYLETRARLHWSTTSNALRQVIPDRAKRIDNESSGKWIPRDQLVSGDIVEVNAGELVPADGQITSGTSSIDTAMLTGEFNPVAVHEGDRINAGTRNIEGKITVQVVEASLGSMNIGKLLDSLENVQHLKSPIEKLADRTASYFVLAVLGVTLFTYLYWSLHAPEHAFWITLSALVATCPCALSLAMPTALAAAQAKSAQLGLHIFNPDLIGRLRKVKHIIFDKTGTLTAGEPSLQHFWLKDDDQRYLHCAAAMELETHHPLRHAFSAYQYQATAINLTQVTTTVGKGIQAYWQGKEVKLGQPLWVGDTQVLPNEKDLLDQGTSKISMTVDGEICGRFYLEDAIRKDAEETLNRLAHSGFTLHLLSGDQTSSVGRLAKKLRVNHWQGLQSPQDKLTYIERFEEKDEPCLMVGDGLNDLPVMSRASTSIAMGSASTIARIHADAYLKQNNLGQLVSLFRLSSKTQNILKLNIIWAICYNMLILPVAVSGYLPPWGAAIGMTASSLLVTLNSLRLMK